MSTPGKGLPVGSVNFPPVNVNACGADPTGVADSSAAFQVAANSGWAYAPKGIYRLGSAISFPNVAGAGLYGDGPGATLIKADFLTGNVLASANFQVPARFEGFTLGRVEKCIFTGSVTGTVLTVTFVASGTVAVGDFVCALESSGSLLWGGTKILSFGTGSGGTGTYNLTSPHGSQTTPSQTLYTYRVTSGSGIYTGSSSDITLINNVQIRNQYDGLLCGAAGFDTITNSYFQYNANHGVNVNNVTSGIGQWQMSNLWSQGNGGDGYHLFSSTSGTSGGQMSQLNSGANVGYGFYSENIANIRLNGGFFGTDRLDEVFITGGNAAYEHILTNVTAEFSRFGYGFDFASGLAGGVSLVNCQGIANALAGVFFNCPGYNLNIIGGQFDYNGQSAVTPYGIYMFRGKAGLVGVKALATSPQTFGIVVDGSVVGPVAVSCCNATISGTTTTSPATY